VEKKEKMSESDFKHSLYVLVGEESAKNFLESMYFGEGLLTSMFGESDAAKYLNDTASILRERGISNIVFTPTLTRGFDYYTGVVFEVFDTNRENSRSIFGGGRYDNLIGNFSSKSLPAFGFGMGDVTIKDFLLTHGLMPKLPVPTRLYICIVPETPVKEVYGLAEFFRKNGVNTAVDISNKKLGDQLKSLDKRKIPFVLTVGPEEIKNNKFTVRNTETREEKSGDQGEILKVICGK